MLVLLKRKNRIVLNRNKFHWSFRLRVDSIPTGRADSLSQTWIIKMWNEAIYSININVWHVSWCFDWYKRETHFVSLNIVCLSQHLGRFEGLSVQFTSWQHQLRCKFKKRNCQWKFSCSVLIKCVWWRQYRLRFVLLHFANCFSRSVKLHQKNRLSVSYQLPNFSAYWFLFASVILLSALSVASY